MELYHVFVLSAVEGVTEFLPISSTAHLIMTSRILQIPSSDFLGTFDIAIQLGAIGAVATVSRNQILKNKNLIYKAVVGFIPTGIFGVLFYSKIKHMLSDPLIPVIALFLGGIAIIGIEQYFKRKHDESSEKLLSLEKMTYKDSLKIGLIQSLSMIPGVSRSASSIFGSMAIGYNRKAATEFSFILAIPTMAAATSLDLIRNSQTFSTSQTIFLLVGIVLSYLTALISIKWLLKYLQKNSFFVFGIYRIIIAILFYFLLLH